MPNSMAEASDAECGGDEEGRAEVNNEGGGIRSRDEGGDDSEFYSGEDSIAGLNGGEEERLPARFEVVGSRFPTEYNYIGSSSSSEGVFPNKRREDLGPDTKDTELRLGLPQEQDDGGNKAFNAGVRLPDPACFDGISQGGKIKQKFSRNELNATVPRCYVDSQARMYSIHGKEFASNEEFKLKPMFREFTSVDLPFNVRFSVVRPPLENIQNKNARVTSSGAKRAFSETLESSASGETKLYLPPSWPAPAFKLPPPWPAWRLKWELEQRNKTSYGQFSGHMELNEAARNEVALPAKTPVVADQKKSPAESQNQAGNSSEQRASKAVGWPPVRSFRRNLASQPKLVPPAPPNAEPAPPFTGSATMFVKVNAEGDPIGRKIDLRAYDNYDKLALALDDMFRNSITVQNPSFSSANPSLSSGDYVLVYEDDEGDRMLVGDVPWGMFVTTVKRLRIIRSSEARGLDRESSLKALKAKAAMK